MSELDDDDRLDLRRQAVDELKQEILAQLRGMTDACTPVIQYPAEATGKLDRGQLEQIIQEVRRLGPVYPAQVPAERFVFLDYRRLLWLLALSEQERAFVQATLDVVLDAGRAWGELSVFADWLEENLRFDDATLVRRLVPQDGDVLTFIVRGDLTARERRVARGCIQSAITRLRSRGANVGCLVLGDGLDLAFLAEEKMADQGWVPAQHLAQLREQNNQLRAFLAQEGYPPLAPLSEPQNPEETQP